MSRHYHPLPFSPAGEFVWNRSVIRDGVQVKVGDPVDKRAFTPLRLRQLYESRMIAPSPFEAPPPAFLNNGIGKADQLAAELAKEEARDGEAAREVARVPAAPRRADAAKPAAAAQPAPAKGVARKPAPRRTPKPAAAPARGVSV